MKKACAQARCIPVLGVLLSGVLLLWCPDAVALDPALDVSQYAHTTWNVREGFFKGYINAIAQTPDGYLWLGTEFGLLRFDGVRSVQWQPPDGQHLPPSIVYSLVTSQDGTLWIGTDKGLASWKGGKLTQYKELAGQIVYRLLEDHEGSIWIGGASIPTSRLCKIQNGTVHCYEADGGFGDGVYSLYEDHKGNLWAGVRNGLWQWKPGPPKFYPLQGEQDGIRGLGEDGDGTLLIGMRGGIRRLVHEKFEAYALPSMVGQFKASGLLRDTNGGLWIGTEERGLVHVHHGRTDVYAQPDGLSGDYVLTLFEDREGTIWVGTWNGLDRFRDFAVSTLSLNQGLSNMLATAVLAAKDGSVWLATLGGLDRWNHGQITTFGTKADPQAQRRANAPNSETVDNNKRHGIWNGFPPLSLFQEASGRIWASTLLGTGYLENDRFVPMSALHRGRVPAITEDTQGSLWIANQDFGLFQLRRGSLIHKIAWAKLGHRDFATALAPDPLQGGLWVGFINGGVAYLKDGEVRASYTAADGLGAGRVISLRVEPDGTLWASTAGGLSRVRNNRVETLNSKNGLPCDGVHGVLEDDDHFLWLDMTCGLVRIAPSELDTWAVSVKKDGPDKAKDANWTIQATVFDISDGVRSHATSNELYGPQITKSLDGKLWFLPSDGVSVVDPRRLPFNKLPPPVHIEQITADRKTYDGASDSKGPLRLPPLVRDLEIDYTALSLVAPEKVLFRYKLEGRDRDWQNVGNRRQAYFTDLPPDNYRFRVAACNNSGVWNEAGTSFDFSILPAYYQTNWFRWSCVASFMALLTALYQLRQRQLARQFDMRLEGRVSERTRIARELHDSLLQGFQGLMFRLQAVRDMLPGRAPVEAIEALDIALERGDKAIAEGRDTVSDLRQSAVGDSDLAKALTALGDELATQCNEDAPGGLRVLVEGKQRELNPTLRDEIYRIAREALRNAFRHAKAQKIEAEITYGDSEFLLHVRDDGSGIDPAVATQGARAGHWGLPGMRERAKSFGGKLEVWSEHGAGTEIELRVPGAIAYGKSDGRRTFWFWRKKNEETNGQQSQSGYGS